MSRPSKADLEKPNDISTPNQAQAFHGFRSDADHYWFQTCFESRPVLKERSIDLNSFSAEVSARIVHRRWNQYLEIESECNSSMVREFYASLVSGTDYRFHAFVRGRGLSFDSEELATFMAVPELSEADVPWGRVPRPSTQALFRMLTGTEGDLIGKNYQISDCTPFYRYHSAASHCSHLPQK